MKIKEEKALLSFNSGLNCAQSVLSAYTEELKIDPEIALGISCGFGGGMGRLQETCGAATGAFMVLGIHNCKMCTDNKDRKEKTYAMVQEFSDKFKSIYGTMDCRSLINCDLRTEEGQRYAKENKVHETICEKCVFDSVRIIEELRSHG
jgi:C_GCAxxG_C_C family probable redox protein